MGRALEHLPAKCFFQILPSFIKNSEMGAGFVTCHVPLILSDFIFVPPFFSVALRGRGTSGSRRGFWGWLDEVWRKGDVDGAVHHHFENLVETDEAVVHHRPVLEFQALAEPTLDPDF